MTFISQKISRLSTFPVTRVMRQILVNEVNYQFFIDVKYSSTVVLRYLILVTESANGAFEIKKQDFTELAPFDATKLRIISNVNETPYWKDIEPILRNKVVELKSYAEFTQAEVSEPYYVLTFKKTDGAKIKITFLYNIFKQEITIIKQEEIKAPIPGPLQQVENFESDSSVNKVLNFLKDKFASSYSLFRVTKVFKQLVVSGFYYEFHLDIKYSDKTVIHYLLAVAESNEGKYEIVKK